MKKIFFIILGMILSAAVLMNEAAAQTPKIRIGEFTGSSGGTTVEEPESGSSKGLTDADVEFMYNAGLLDEAPFFRQRISVAYNLFYINNRRHFRYEGGTLVGIYHDKKNYSHGIAVQYHCGVSFLREYDWRGNPFFGLNLLLDGSFGSGGGGNIASLGLGGEIHFLWIYKIAAGATYIQSENRIFKSAEYADPGGFSMPIKDKKSTTIPFFQVGITIPVSNKADLFALVNWNGEDRLDIFSYRAGVAMKF